MAPGLKALGAENPLPELENLAAISSSNLDSDTVSAQAEESPYQMADAALERLRSGLQELQALPVEEPPKSSPPAASTRQMALTQTQTSSGKAIYQCFGTEPFWMATVFDGRMIFTIMGQEPIELFGSLKAPHGVGASYIESFISDSAALNTMAGACNDGMSETMYSRHGIITFTGENKESFAGCCQPVP